MSDPPPPLARRPILTLAGAVALVLPATSLLDGYWFGELYFIAAGKQHLAVSYADQPPLVPAPDSDTALWSCPQLRTPWPRLWPRLRTMR